MVNVDFESLYMIDNKQRLMASHWNCECLMMNCGTDFQQVNKEHNLFVRAVRELRNALEKVENAEKVQFADYQAKADIDNLYGK